MGCVGISGGLMRCRLCRLLWGIIEMSAVGGMGTLFNIGFQHPIFRPFFLCWISQLKTQQS